MRSRIGEKEEHLVIWQLLDQHFRGLQPKRRSSSFTVRQGNHCGKASSFRVSTFRSKVGEADVKASLHLGPLFPLRSFIDVEPCQNAG